MPDAFQLQEKLVNSIQSLDCCAVAFSAGVDSSVVAKATYLALGDNAVAVTANAMSLASGELEQAVRIAKLIGIRHEIIQTNEIDNPKYIANNADRCFHCKSELYQQIEILRPKFKFRFVLNGTNCDDLGDYRPGLDAARNFNVRSPLVECGLNKSDVRSLARYWQMPVWDKPAMPCLASRIAYRQKVTPERLKVIDQGEAYLRALGFQELRVRYHENGLARIEVAPEQLPRLVDPAVRIQICAKFEQLGFRFVTIDLSGFRSGNLNQLISINSTNTQEDSEPGGSFRHYGK